MQRIAAIINGKPDQLFNVEVRTGTATLQQNGFIGFAAMQRVGIFLAIHRNGRDAQFSRRPGHANCNFASIGDQ